MIKKIRLKFVIITMSLLTVVFSVIFVANQIYNNYLYKTEMLGFLETISETDSFFEAEYFADDESIDIYTAVLDNTGKIKNIRSTSNADKEKITDIIYDIYDTDETKGRQGSHIFVKKYRQNSDTVIALADIYATPLQFKKIASTGILILIGYVLLFGISLYLSRFVTKPAKEALEREKQFISNASHELKTPVAAIILNAQAMSKTDSHSKHLDIILSEAERMKSLIKRLLTLAYADECNNSTERQFFSLSDICEEMVLSFESLAFENKIDFDYDIQKNVQYNGISEDIRQVVSILLDNAFKYTSEGGKITIKLLKESKKIVFTVRNTGEGISPDDLPHIFERFYCRDKSRNNSFGLGLSIAYAIVTAHSGTIKANSVYNEYTQFTVVL